MPVAELRDDCMSAEDVRAKAKAVLERRRRSYGIAKQLLFERDNPPPKPVSIFPTTSGQVVARFQRSILDETEIHHPKIREIISVVSKCGNISKKDLVSCSKSYRFIPARYIAMMLCRLLTDKSSPQIGSLFNRDHTSVLYAIAKMEIVRKELEKNLSSFLSVEEIACKAFALYEKYESRIKKYKPKILRVFGNPWRDTPGLDNRLGVLCSDLSQSYREISKILSQEFNREISFSACRNRAVRRGYRK